jgi:hypothetical protein
VFVTSFATIERLSLRGDVSECSAPAFVIFPTFRSMTTLTAFLKLQSSKAYENSSFYSLVLRLLPGAKGTFTFTFNSLPISETQNCHLRLSVGSGCRSLYVCKASL